jgi:tripartite-type tricarboxylate transporter receptor subunit TctC
MMLIRRLAVALTVGASVLHPWSDTAGAAEWPARVVKIVVPSAPGGSSDAAARIIANHFQAVFGQPFVIESKPGAGGGTGAAFVAQAEPDGYTLLISNTAANLTIPLVQKNFSYDPVKDFTHIAMLSGTPYALCVHPSLGVTTLAGFIAKAKQNPGVFTYTAANTGGLGHMSGEYFKRLAGIDMRHVPYRGGAPATADAIAGHVQAILLPLSTLGEHVRSGELVALAVSSRTRSAAFPDLPTFAESGFAQMVYRGWFGLSGPKGLPAPIVSRLNTEARVALKTPVMRDMMEQEGSELLDTDSAGFTAMIAGEVARWSKILATMDIRLEE